MTLKCSHFKVSPWLQQFKWIGKEIVWSFPGSLIGHGRPGKNDGNEG